MDKSGYSISGAVVSLNDGSQALLRPLVASDRQRIVKGMGMLSGTTRYFRFFTPISQLSEEQLDYFTDVDQFNHVAWIALDPSTAEHDALGTARFVRPTDHDPVAEMAFTVIDSHQNRGLGTYLLAALCLRARELDIRTLRAFVLPENSVVGQWLRQLGGCGACRDGLFEFDLPVPSLNGMPGHSPSNPKFEAVLGELRHKLLLE